MSSRNAVVSRLVLLATGLLVGFTGLGRTPKGRVYVVAIRDSQLLTLCPVFGKDVADVTRYPAAGAAPRNPVTEDARVQVRYDWSPRPWASEWEDIMVMDHQRGQGPPHGSLPVPLSRLRDTSSTAQTGGAAQLERLASDDDVKTLVEDELRRNGYTTVNSVESADSVFLIESYYEPLTVFRGDEPTRTPEKNTNNPNRNSPDRIWSDTEEALRALEEQRHHQSPPAPAGGRQPLPPAAPPAAIWSTSGGDRVSNWRGAAVAVVVTPGVYQQHVDDAQALTASTVWSGFSFVHVSVQRNSSTGVLSPASPVDLVRQFVAKRTAPSYLPVCAGSWRPAISPAGTDSVATANPKEPTSGGAPVGATFHAAVLLVTVPFTAADTSGRPFLDLKPSECHVVEDGIEQKIARLADVASSVNLALVFDTSASMAWDARMLRTIPTTALSALRPQDRMMLVSFDDRIRVHSDLTADRHQLQSAVSQLKTGQGTRFYDALDLVVQERLQQEVGRTAVVLFTDGVDTGSRVSGPRDALATVDASSVVVYVIRYTPTSDKLIEGRMKSPAFHGFVLTPDDRQANARGDDPVGVYLQRLSGASEGRLYNMWDIQSLEQVFQQISEELSHQYTLYYYPSSTKPDGAYHHITVSVDRPGCTVRAREGYRAPTERKKP